MEDKRIELSDEQMKWADEVVLEEMDMRKGNLTIVRNVFSRIFRSAKTELEKEIEMRIEGVYELVTKDDKVIALWIIVDKLQEYIRKLKESQVTNK